MKNVEMAKHYFLNMLKIDGSKSICDFSKSLKSELEEDPKKVFKAVDLLRGCNDVVPSWFCRIWNKSFVTESCLSLDTSRYSVLIREIMEEIKGIIQDELVVYEYPEYCQNEFLGDCWLCDRRKNYKDCKGNIPPQLFCKELNCKKWDYTPSGYIPEYGIKLGSNYKDNTIIECAHCGTLWDIYDNKVCMLGYYGCTSYLEYDEKLEIIFEGLKNKKHWYLCPLNCHFV